MLPLVRLATIKDADVLSSLNYEFNGGDKRPEAEIIESLNTGNELVAVAELWDEVVGFACGQSSQSFCYAASHGEITEMYVQESARRKGVAVALLAFLEAQLRLRGVGTVKILTGRTNDPAVATYASCGYVKHDEVFLEKRL